MDVRSQLSQLSPEAREALRRRIMATLDDDAVAPEREVVIMGGGAAGLTLALELHGARPHTRILVISANSHPVPEITHTVGESTVEVSAHYLRERLGLAEHLQSSQIRKMGLRMFFSREGNVDIAERLELGSSRFIPQVTYQIDRGRLENELDQRCRAAGIDIVHGRAVSIALGANGRAHTLSVQSGDTVTTTTARWVVDASGRNRALARQLGLRRGNEHRCNAVWLRVATELDVGSWSDDPYWQARLVEGDRALSTNHLMGEGYWVWLIRLPSGSTSVGIVADPACHDFDGFNTLAKARSWLREHEPQCAAVLAEHEHLIKDFRVMKNYSHGATKVYSGRDRWCCTGDAAVFLDPLYSSGLDLAAIGNGLITDMITRELEGEDVAARAGISDSLFRSLTEMWLAIYCDQYPLMGSPAVMTAKVIWDIAFYWGFVGLLYRNGKFVSVADDPQVVPHLEGLIDLSNRTQRFFREWAAIESVRPTAGFVDLYTPLNFMVTLHTAMIAEAPDFAAQFDANTTLLHQLAGQLVDTVIAQKCDDFAEDRAVRQVQAWQQDALVRKLRSIYRREQARNPLSQGWILGATPALEAR